MLLWNKTISNIVNVGCYGNWVGLLSNPALLPSTSSVPNWNLTCTDEANMSFPANDHGIYMSASSSRPAIHNGAMITQGYDPIHAPELPSLNIRVGDYSHYQFLVDAYVGNISFGINGGAVLLARVYLYSEEGISCTWVSGTPPHPGVFVHNIEIEWVIGGDFTQVQPCAVIPKYDLILMSNVLDPIPIGLNKRKIITVSLDEALQTFRDGWTCWSLPYLWIIDSANVDNFILTGTSGWLEVWNGNGEGTFYYLDLLVK